MRILFLFLLFSSNVMAVDIMAGLRESFISEKYFPFGGDSSARLRKSIKGQGFDHFVLNTKLSTNKINSSYIYRPRWSSNMRDLETMISYIRFGNGTVTIKPQIVHDEDLVTIVPYEINSSNIQKNLLIHTYQKELTGYLRLSRETDFKRLVIGHGLSKLYESKRFTQSLVNLQHFIRKGLSKKTELALNLNSLNTIKVIATNFELMKSIRENIDTIYYTLDNSVLSSIVDGPEQLYSEIERMILTHKKIFGNIGFSISNVILPVCSSIDLFCAPSIESKKVKKLLESFAGIIKDIETRYAISSVELMISTTNYEPDHADKRFLYYWDFFKMLNFNEMFTSNSLVRVDTPIIPKERPRKKLCVYYDGTNAKGEKDKIGGVHSTMLISLLGAFPEYSAKRYDISAYKSFDIKGCNKVFYIANNYTSIVTKEFLDDLTKYIDSNDVMWFNYKISDFLKTKKAGFEIGYTLSPNVVPTRESHDIGFYQYFEYKGEEFFKKSGWSLQSEGFLSSPELNQIIIKNKKQVDVLSFARHNKTNLKTPYIVTEKINNGRLWYFADLPFSFVHYEDRYLILTDILWDFLDVLPPTGPQKAIVRFEDVVPTLEFSDLNWAMQFLKKENVPFAMAVIPFFADMMGQTEIGNYNATFKPATRYPEFVSTLKLANKLGADFVWHGVAHQVDDFLSGYNGISGSDYEFWLYPENIPIPYDSVDWVMNRLKLGEDVFRELGIIPSVWELPHYAASVLDYYIFGKIFEWNYHRSVIFDHKVIGDSEIKKNHHMFECLSSKCREDRRALLRNIKIDADYSTFGASFSPYPIYKDAYGQKTIPETLGMIDFAFYSPDTWRPVSKPEDILRRAKKLKVIRGAFASFFWHTHLLNSKVRYYVEVPGSYESIGGRNSLKLVVKGLKKLGYEFVSISDCKIFPQKRCRK